MDSDKKKKKIPLTVDIKTCHNSMVGIVARFDDFSF